MAQSFFERHNTTLKKAIAATHERSYWSAYPESASRKVYGEEAPSKGLADFEALLGKPFQLHMAGIEGTVAGESSPFGIELGISYPKVNLEKLIPAMQQALPPWRDAGMDARAGVCLEILQRLNQNSFLIAHAVMHTSGQAFAMAFQAGGPHAQDRGLEAVAYAYEAMSRAPQHATWRKPQGKHTDLVMTKVFHTVPCGLALVIGCSTFPTWNAYPGLFASLVTGNPVIVKPHGDAILPAAISVRIAQQVLQEAGFDPSLLSLVVDGPNQRLASDLALRPEVKIIDYTGGNEFGVWLEQHAYQAQVYTEKAGVNSIVIDSTVDGDEFKGLVRNIAFSLSLYSGQMCTSPQNIYIPKTGISIGAEKLSFDQVAQAISDGVAKFLSNNDRAVEVLGCIRSPATLLRLQESASLGETLLSCESRTHPKFPNATVRTPTLIKVVSTQQHIYGREHFGPIGFIIATENSADSIECATQTAKQNGAMTWGIYASDEKVLAAMEAASLDAGVALSCNLTGGVFVNQSAAFSDFHATGCNPAANACLTDVAFVANRFRVVQSRRHSA